MLKVTILLAYFADFEYPPDLLSVTVLDVMFSALTSSENSIVISSVTEIFVSPLFKTLLPTLTFAIVGAVVSS